MYVLCAYVPGLRLHDKISTMKIKNKHVQKEIKPCTSVMSISCAYVCSLGLYNEAKTSVLQSLLSTVC